MQLNPLKYFLCSPLDYYVHIRTGGLFACLKNKCIFFLSRLKTHFDAFFVQEGIHSQVMEKIVTKTFLKETHLNTFFQIL